MNLSFPKQHAFQQRHSCRCDLNSLVGATSLPKPLSWQGQSQTLGSANWRANYMSEVSLGDINRIMGENRHQIPIPIGAMTLCQGAVSAKRYGV
jgi:hypothetical protein